MQLLDLEKLQYYDGKIKNYVAKTYAPLASPSFTGTPTSTTPTAGDSSTKIATTKYVQTELGTAKVASAGEFTAAKSVTLTGDVTGSASSKGGWSIAATLASSGVTADTYGPSANASPAHSGTFTVPKITVDAKGRVTSASNITITLPASGNVDTKVTQTVTANTDEGKYPILAKNVTATATITDTSRFVDGITIQPSTGAIQATKFIGAVEGNASTATKLATARNINGTSFNGTSAITTANWGTARNISISDADGTNTGNETSVNGSTSVTLKLPSTIKASLEGNASSADSVPWSGIDGKPSTFAPSSHNQASNTINAMTGYSKPSSTSAIGTSDTLNAAIGKLEKALDDKAASSHGTHVTFSADAPKAAGTASAGGSSTTTVAKSDHVHPLQTTVSGNAGTATKFASSQTVALTGDVTGSASSQAGWSIATTLADSGVTAGTYGDKTQQTPSHGGTFNIPYYTVDAKGRVTEGGTTTVKLPADNNTDTKVNVTLGTTTKAYLLGTSTTPTSTATGVAAISDTGVYLDTTAGRLTAGSFAGNGQNITLATANAVVTTDANKKLTASTTVTTTELGYLDGVTSSIQTQLNGKASDADVVHKTGDETIEGEKTFSDGISVGGLHYLGDRDFTIGTAGTGSGTYLQVNSIVDSKSITIANQGTNNITFTSKGNITATGTITGNKIVGDGSSLTALNGSQITSGTVDAARIASLNASKITSGTFDAARIPSLDASKITSGTIDVARLPAGALPILKIVDNETARFALTSSDVQVGDTVQQTDTGLMYYVKDVSKLDSADGYAVYTAGAATSVPWSGVTGKPSTFAPSAHNQASNTINAMTGYSKPSSTSAIGTSDTLNAAIGKLEKALDGKQASGSYAAASHNQASNTINAMTGYSKPSSTSAIGTSDTLNAAIGKLEKALDGKATAATTLAGYNISDAKIASGVITLGSSTITPLTSSSSLNAAKLTGTASVNTTGKATTAGTADQVASSLTLKLKSGTTEGTDLYTFNGSGAKTLDIKQGSNVTLTAAEGSLTIAAKDTVYTHPTTSGNKHIPSGGSSGQILRWSADGTAAWGADNNTTYSNFVKSGSGAAAGLVPAPSTTEGNTKYLREDGTWAVPPDNNTTYSTFVKSGSSAAAGLVPKPSTTAGTTKYLREDGTWAVPPDNNTTYSNFVKSGSSAAAGLVPAPSTTAGTTKYLREDGTWAVPPDNNTVYTHPTTSGNKHVPIGGSSGQFLGWDSDGTAKWVANPNSDTKNTAGSTDTSSKIFLVGATSQAANPQTYSHDTAYVGTDGCLYSGGAKVLTAHQTLPTLSYTESGSGNAVTGISVSGHAITATKGSTFLTSHQSLANYVTLNGAQTISGVKTFTAKPVLNQVGLDMTVKDTTEGSTTTRTSQVLHANSSNCQYGINIAFCSGGNAVVGGGEAGTAQLSDLAGNSGEDLYLVADGNIYLKPNGNTWANAKTITLNTAGELSGLAKVTATSFVGKMSGTPEGTTFVAAVTEGNALVNATTTGYGGIWNAPTKNYRVGCSTYPSSGDDVRIAYSVTNANVTAGTNTVAKSLTWNADSGVLTATSFSGPLTGNASTATKLATARSLKTKLDSTTAVTFDGSGAQDAIPVTGTLPVANGGTGQTSVANIQAGKDVDGNAIKTTYAKLASPALTGTPTAPTASNRTNSTQIATTAFVANNAARYLGANTTIYASSTAAGDGSGSSAANAMSLLNLQTYLASARMQPLSTSINSSYRLTVLFVPTGSTYGDVTFDFNKMPGVRYLTIGTSTGTASTTSNYTTNSPLFGNITVSGSPLSVTINNIQSTGTITACYGAQVVLGTYAGFARLYAHNYGRIDVGNGTYNIHNAGLSCLCYSAEYGQIILNSATMAFNFREQCYFTTAIFASDAHGRLYVNYGRSKFTGTKPIVSQTISGTKTGTSATAAGTAAKAVALAEGQTFTLANNAVAYVTFDNTNTAANPTLNINGTGAKPIYYNGAAIPAGYINKHVQYKFTYNGTQYVCGNVFQRVEQIQSMAMLSYGSNYNTTYNSGEWNWDGFSRYWGNGCWVNNNFQGNLTGNVTGNLTGNAATATKLPPQAAAALPTGNLAQDGLQLVEVYNNSYPYSYGNVINVQGTTHRGAGQLFLAWSGNDNGIANIYYRNKRDSITTWSDWKQIAFTDSAITGNAGSATKLATARNINGTSFDGTAAITTANWGTARNIYVSDSDGTNTGAAVSVNGSANATLKLPATIKASITGNVSGSSGSCTGNAATATKLATARTINGVSFDGSANITVADSTKLPLAGGTMTGDLNGTTVIVSGSFAKKHPSITKGTNPSATQYWTLTFADKNGTNYSNNCLGMLETSITSAGVVSTYIRAMKNAAADSTNAQITAVYDTANSVAYATCPTPASATENSTKIATTAWCRTATGNFACNSATATKFASSQSVTLTGAITGTASSQAGWSVSTVWRSCMVGQSGSTNTNPWYKVATFAVTTTNDDIMATFLVEDTYSSHKQGILKVHVRTDGSKVISSTASDLIWLSHTGFTLADFVLVCPTAASSTVELWTKIATSYMYRRFTVLSEGSRSSTSIRWTLLNASSAGQAASITTTGTQIASTLAGQAASCTGNAATATKLATARTINGVSFDGSANITVADSTKLPLSGGTLTGSLTGTAFIYKSTNIDRADTTTDSSVENWVYAYRDKNNNDIGNYGVNRYPKTGQNRHRFRLRNTSNGWADLVFEFKDSGQYFLWMTGSSGTTNGGFSGNVTGSSSSCTGNAATATKLATARSLWGNNFDGSAAISGTITGTPSIEFKPAATTSNNGGYLDFHYNQSTADYTSRIIESASGTLSINNVTITTGKVVTATTFTGALSGNASSATITKGNKGTGSYVTSVKSGNALVNADNTQFGTIFNAPTKNYRVGCATWPDSNDNIVFYSITNANVASSTNTVAKSMTWNGDTGILTATGFAGPLTGNVTGNVSGSSGSCTGNAATATKLATARTINGVSFDGSANITVADSTKLPLAGGTMTGQITYKVGSITRGTAPSSSQYPWGIRMVDNANVSLSGLYYEYLTDKTARSHLMCYQGTTNANTWHSIGAGYDASGNPYTWARTPGFGNNSTQIATTEFVYKNAAKHLAAATSIYVATAATGNGSGSNTSNYMSLADLRNYLATVHMHSSTADMNGSYTLTILFKAGDSFGNASFDAAKMPGIRNLLLNTSTGTASTTSNYSTNSPTFGNITVTGDIAVTIRNINCTGRISAQYGAYVAVDTYVGLSSLHASNWAYVNVAKNMVIDVCDAHTDYLFAATNSAILAMWPGATVTINFRQQCWYSRCLFMSSTNGTILVGYSSFKLTGTKPMSIWAGTGTLTGTSETAAGTAAKVVPLASGQTFTLATNATAKVRFTNDNTAANPTLNINSTGAKAIWWNGAAVAANMLAKNMTYDVKYDGTRYVIQNTIKRLTNNDFGVFRYSGDHATTYNSGSWNFSDWTPYYGTGLENSTFRGSHIGNIQQNVSSTDNTYPILFTGTANATANTSTYPYFGSGVKINPKTSTIYATTFSGAFSGNASTATKLATARSINIQDSSATNTGTAASFDGSGNATIKLPATIKASITGNCSGSSGSCTGNAATATKLATARTINGVSFDGSANITVADSTKLPLAGGTMTGDLVISKSNPLFVLKATNITRNTAPSANYTPVAVEHRDSADRRLWGIYYNYNTDKTSYARLIVNKGNTTDNTWTGIGVGYDKDGNWFTYAPTPATADNSTKIATTAFVKAQGYLTSHQSLANYLPLSAGSGKTLTGNLFFKRSTPQIILQSSNYKKGTNPSATEYHCINFADNAGTDIANRIGVAQASVDKNGKTCVELIAYKYVSGNTSNYGGIGICYDASGSSAYTYAPTPATSDNSTKIATTAFVKAQGYTTATGHTHSYLPLSGGTMTGALTQKHTGLVKGSAVSAWTCRDYRVIDNSGDSGDKPCLSWWRTAVGTDKKVSVTINAFKFADESTASASIGIHYPVDGDAYTNAPTPAAGDNSTKIATTAFVASKFHFSTSAPSDSTGANGDVWYQYV